MSIFVHDIVLTIFIVMIDALECELCCLEGVFVCGTKWDCDEGLRSMIMSITLSFISLSVLLALSCILVGRVRGDAYKRKFAQVVLQRDEDQR